MEKEKTKSGEQKEEYVILLDLHGGSLEVERLQDIPRSWPMGQYCSVRTGPKSVMEDLRKNLIINNLKTLMKHG